MTRTDRLIILAAFTACLAVVSGCAPPPLPAWQPVKAHEDFEAMPPGNDGAWHFLPPGSR